MKSGWSKGECDTKNGQPQKDIAGKRGPINMRANKYEKVKVRAVRAAIGGKAVAESRNDKEEKKIKELGGQV